MPRRAVRESRHDPAGFAAPHVLSERSGSIGAPNNQIAVRERQLTERSARNITEAQRAAAAGWWVRLDRPDPAPDERAAFAAWCAADPCHLAAFEETRALWRGLADPAAEFARKDAARYVGLVRKARAPASSRQSGFTWRLLAAGFAALVMALTGWLAYPSLNIAAQNVMADASTAAGKRQQFDLADGSQMELAGNSAVAIEVDATQRRVTLLRGEAYFAVEPNAALPFTVHHDGAWVRVVGTAFNLRADPDRLTVTVTEGKVAIGADGLAADTQIDAGAQSAIIKAESGYQLTPATAADFDQALAWRQDRLVFQRRRLADVTAELEQLGAGRIVIWQEDHHDLRISGTFPTGDIPGTLAAIADTLKLRRANVTPWLTIFY
jgi:transmembrane sensor